MMRKLNVILWVASISLLLAPFVAARLYTSSDGKRMEADYLSSSDTHVTLKLKRNGREYTTPIEHLSKSDQEYVAGLKTSFEEEERGESAAEARITAADAAAQKIAQFAQKTLGKKVGNGECWTLADDAYKAAGVKRPGEGSRVWGRELNWDEEKVRPGDILELESAQFSNGGRSAANHTAVIIGCKRKGVITVYHQNWGVKKVTTQEFDLKSMTSGKAKIYRYE